MPGTTSIRTFILLSLVLIATPGPSIMFIVAQTLRLGFTIAMRTVYGNALGFCIQIALVSVGAATVISHSPERLSAMQTAGAAYLTFLGARSIYKARTVASTNAGLDTLSTNRSAVRDGFVVGVTNPKSLVFFIAVLPEYVNPSGYRPSLQMLLLGMIFVIMAIAIDATWALLAGAARTWFATNGKRMYRVTVFGGLIMVALGIQLAVTS